MEELISELITLLQQAGLPAVPAMRDVLAPRLEQPACAVRLERACFAPPGFAQYLGVREDPERGSLELYGAKLSATLEVQVYGPTKLGAEACTRAVERVTEALLAAQQSFPLQDIEIKTCGYDAKYDHFSASVQFTVQRWIYATAGQDTQSFTDFHLRGELL